MAQFKYGDIIRGKAQYICVNDYASQINPDKWNITDETVIDYGEKWYYGSLKYKDNSKSEQYLIHDQVGSDGYGSIIVYKDVNVIGHISNHIPVRESVMWSW